MQSLEEFNSQRWEITTNGTKPHPNGIECPKCKSELWDTNPSFVLTSFPPQKNVHCPKCGFKGLRFN